MEELKLISLMEKARAVVAVGSLRLGSGFTIIASPRSVESESRTITKEVVERYLDCSNLCCGFARCQWAFKSKDTHDLPRDLYFSFP